MTPSLPRFVAMEQIQLVSPTHVQLGDFDVYQLTGGRALILAPDRTEIPLQDAQAGLRDFLASAKEEAQQGFSVVSVGYDTLAHLFGQRALTLSDLRSKNVIPMAYGVHAIAIPARNGSDEYSIWFHPDWTYTVTAGGREEH